MKKSTMPLFGVGPLYVAVCLTLTLLALFCHHKGLFSTGQVTRGGRLMTFLGILLLLGGVYLWIQAVLVSRLNRSIKENRLVTSGIYAVVRNPIYTAFLACFTGILLCLQNVYVLILPPLYYLFLTFLMVHTEEKWLLRAFGDEYRHYCQHVNRVIPWFKR